MSLTPAAPGPAMRRPGRWALWLFGLVIVGTLAAVAWAQWRQFDLLGRQVRYSDDNVIWSFIQLENETQRLREALAVAAARPTPVVPEALALRYEIFVSRVHLIDPSRIRAVLATPPDHDRIQAQLLAFVTAADAVLVEGAPLRQGQLAGLQQGLDDLRGPIHELPLLASRESVLQADVRSEALRSQVRLGIGLTAGLTVVALAFAALVVAQWRVASRHRTDLQALAERLTLAREAADRANQAKTTFLANMSHELRTPFNGLLGMLSLLDDARLNAEQRGFLHTARDAAEHLLTVLDGILDVSRLEAGQLPLQAEALDLPRLLRDVETVMRPTASGKGLSLMVHQADDLPLWVRGDATRLRQILFNLLNNAIKFTDQGQVQLRVDREAPTGGPDVLRFEVEDTGIGMSDATQARLFQRFSQGDESISRRYGGTGLGLEISRGLARLMQGDIQVLSQPGQGSRFTLHLPLPPCAAPPPLPGPVASLPLPSLDVLVADDHPVNRQYLSTLLQRQGHRVRLAEDGRQALREAERQRPDVILMDLHMPVMDGLQATRALRDRPPPLGRVPIVALTADAYPDTRERVLAAGMDGFLGKPLRWEALEPMLRQWQGRPQVAAAASPEPVAPPASALPAGRAAPADAAVAAEPARPAPGAAPAAEPAPSAPPRPALAPGQMARHLSLDTMAELCSLLGLEGYRPLLQRFFADEGGDFQALCAALEAQDLARAAKLAHRVQGAAQLLGLKQMAQQTRWLARTEPPAAGGAGLAGSPPPDVDSLQSTWQTSQALCRRLGFLA